MKAIRSAPNVLLDELVAFLRAALPRLQDASSTVPREAETSRALARLHALSAEFERRNGDRSRR
jgi:hypothetical protein